MTVEYAYLRLNCPEEWIFYRIKSLKNGDTSSTKVASIKDAKVAAMMRKFLNARKV